jgi:aquaporin Z
VGPTRCSAASSDRAGGYAGAMSGPIDHGSSPAQDGHPAGTGPAPVLKPNDRLAFDEGSREGRRLFGELFGTFLLVLAGAGGAVVAATPAAHAADHSISRAAQVAAPGLTILAVILFMGAVSGAHLNPVVSLSFAARGDFPWRRVPGYVVVQLIGAALACLLLRYLFGSVGHLGATVPGVGVSEGVAFVAETVLTLGLVSTILGTASGAQNVGPLSAVGVAGYIVLAGLWSSPISGASMNPARSFGPDLVAGEFSHFWVYVAGPFTGAGLAVVAAYILRGPGGGPTGRKAAQGAL